ncbi:MAG: hypothetical protein JKY49_09220 [Cohaesibacteraceae bacterium]|nr:hypothetical protein [Cohaesibacteraceae bacterium]
MSTISPANTRLDPTLLNQLCRWSVRVAIGVFILALISKLITPLGLIGEAQSFMLEDGFTIAIALIVISGLWFDMAYGYLAYFFCAFVLMVMILPIVVLGEDSASSMPLQYHPYLIAGLVVISLLTLFIGIAFVRYRPGLEKRRAKKLARAAL